MHNTLRRTGFVFLLTGLAAGCAHTGVKAEADRAKAPDLNKQRLTLSEGYSMLYRDASNLDLAEFILYVKADC